MYSLASDFPPELFEIQTSPCLSLYQPTHRHRPQNQQDTIRFRNLTRSLEESLRQKYPAREAQALLQPFHALAEDREFWNHTLDGLAVLAGNGTCRVYRLQRPVPELVVVADSFHVKPLLRILQSADRFQILAVGRRRVQLYEGNRDSLAEVELARGVPRTIGEALGDELTEPHRTVASYGMGAKGPAMHHGHGTKEEEVDGDAERFFRAVDRAVLEHHSRTARLPLMLAALTEYHALFQSVSHNPYLLKEGLQVNPEALDLDQLRTQAWDKLEPHYRARLDGLVETFQAARAKQQGSDDLSDVARAVLAGRVATLLVEAERQIPGRFDPATGRIELGDLSHPEHDDLLDEMASGVLRTKGEVVIVPAQRMPTNSGLAATYRF